MTKSNTIPDLKYRADAYEDIKDAPRGCAYIAADTFSEVLRFVLWRGNSPQRRAPKAQIVEGLHRVHIADNSPPYEASQVCGGATRAPSSRVVHMHQSVSEAPRATSRVQIAGQGHLSSWPHPSKFIYL